MTIFIITTTTTTATFYDPLIQDNPGELVPETIRHINPHYHHYPPQYLSFALAILDSIWLLVGCCDSLAPASHCVTTSWFAAATQMRARIIPLSPRVVQMPFLPQPSLFPSLGPAQNMLACIPHGYVNNNNNNNYNNNNKDVYGTVITTKIQLVRLINTERCQAATNLRPNQ